jgi:hypothetical protein
MDDPIDKVVEKTASELVEGVSSFFGKICMPAADELGQIIKDNIKFYRLKNLYRISVKTKKLLGSKENFESSISPKLLKEIIDESSWESDDTIQNYWAGLLAGEIKTNSNGDDAIIYTSVLKDMSSYEARLVDIIYSDNCITELINAREGGKHEFVGNPPITIPIVSILKASPTPLNYIVKNRNHEDIINNEKDHGLAFGFIKPQLQSLIRKNLIDDWTNLGKKIEFNVTSSGLDLYMRCSGYKIYPLDAYIATRKYWLSQTKTK